MKERRLNGVAIRRAAPVVTLAVAGAVLLASPAGTTSPASHFWVAGASTNAPAVNRTLGCPETPLLNGVGNPGKDFLCGTSGNDRIVAGMNDIVRGLGGNDSIQAQNGSPNDIDGGSGTNTAWIDRWDTYKWIQRRSVAASPRTRTDRLPSGFEFSLPSVTCGFDLQKRWMIRLELPTGRRIMMAAYDANQGVVDWQYVAWSELIKKFDRASGAWVSYYQSEWLWDRTYDLPDVRGHIPNEWHSFDPTIDDQEVDPEPFLVTEPGDYDVHILMRWYTESAATSSTGALNGIPGRIGVDQLAKDYQGTFRATQDSTTTGVPFYCRFK